MVTKLTSHCQPGDGSNGPPATCGAAFTVDGQRGNQKFLVGGMVTLQADDKSADTYLWQVTSSPPQCDYLLTGATLPQARLTMPGPGAFVVQLTVTEGECSAQNRAILWVATPRRLYRIPADSEALRFDGDPEWAGDLARVIQQVDANLPTVQQKAALYRANLPGEENPEGEWVTLIGKDQGENIAAEDFAAFARLNAYQTLSLLKPAISRTLQ